MIDDKITLEDIVENISEAEILQVRTMDDARALANAELLERIAVGDLDLPGSDLSVRDRLAEEIWKRSPARQS
jgi:hypothetical protein